MTPDVSDRRVEEALRTWRTAEQRLYPLALAWPEGFERHVAMARTVADKLGTVRTIEELVESYGERETITAAAAADALVPTRGLDMELIAGAAFYLRHRELTAQGRRDEMAERIGVARAGGEAWVLIEETDSPTGIPYPPWRRLEMHLPEGTGIHQWVEESLGEAGVEYGVEVVALDPETGRWLEKTPAAVRVIAPDFERWKAKVLELKSEVEAGQPQGSKEPR